MQIYYDILEVPPNCNLSDVKASFRKLSKRYHPDINPGGTAKFLEIKQAYDWVLANHGKAAPDPVKPEPTTSQTKSKPSPQPRQEDQWWQNFAMAEDRQTESIYKKRINKRGSDLRFDRKTNRHVIALKKSEVSEAGIITVAFDNGFSHKIAFRANISDGSLARIGPAVYELRVYADDDWTSSLYFGSGWVD